MRCCPSCQRRSPSGHRCASCGSLLFDTADARVGTAVGGFVLEERIATTEWASVYRGRSELGLGAIKLYRRSIQTSDAARIDRERAVQSRVTSPHVARLLGSGTLADGTTYLVSEWIEGITLEARLRRGAMIWPEIFPILEALGDGLTAIHGADVVHRDLKPSNIMLPERRSPAAVLLDLGHSLPMADVRLTETGWILGSAAYMAPEQAAGAPLSPRTDLYALGVILYRALTGQLPFDAPSPVEVLRCHQLEPVVPPRKLASDRVIPRCAEDLCLWLLAKDPAARLPNAHVLGVTVRALADATEPGVPPCKEVHA